jgi:hypothetical protein|nr:hypothetical protein [Kofleriaceae bacterium]
MVRLATLCVVAVAASATPVAAGTWETDQFVAYFQAAPADVDHVSRIALPQGLAATHALIGRLHRTTHVILESCSDTQCTWVGHDSTVGVDSLAKLDGVVDLAGPAGPMFDAGVLHPLDGSVRAAAPALVVTTRPDGGHGERAELFVISLGGDTAGSRVFDGVIHDGADTTVTDGSYRFVAAADGKSKLLDVVASVRIEKRNTRCLVHPFEMRYHWTGTGYATSPNDTTGHTGC